MELKKFFKDNYEAVTLLQPFTESEEKTYSKNDRDFIRYMQIMFNTSKKDAIKKFEIYKRDLLNNKEERREFQKHITDMYEGLLQYKNADNARQKFIDNAKDGHIEFIKKFEIKSKYSAALGGIPQSKKAVARFKLVNKKSRRYLDTLTGIEVSKRKRDTIVKEISIEEFAEKQTYRW